MPGRILGKFGTCPNRNVSKIFVLGVSMALSFSVSPNLLPCVRIYLFRNLCFLCLSLCISVCANLFLFDVYASLFLFVGLSLFLGLSRFLYVFVSVVRRVFFLALLCLFPRVRVCYLGNVCLFLFLWCCLFSCIFTGRFAKMIYCHVATCYMSPFQIPFFSFYSFFFVFDCYYSCSCLFAFFLCLFSSFFLFFSLFLSLFVFLSFSFSFSLYFFSFPFSVSLKERKKEREKERKRKKEKERNK